MDIAVANFPKLKGKTLSCVDNSSSCTSSTPSLRSKMKRSTIGNLSGIITAMQSDEEGYIGIFGDNYKEYPVSKRNGVLTQLKEVERLAYDIGGGTEAGLWIGLDRAIEKNTHYDNIFIYSDMQAGHGGLYGRSGDITKYKTAGAYYGQHFDVAKMVEAYRRKVNPKVNVFMVQIAGYENVAMPEYGYRTNILSGWTGKEVVFAKEMNEFWDMKDAQKHQKQ